MLQCVTTKKMRASTGVRDESATYERLSHQNSYSCESERNSLPVVGTRGLRLPCAECLPDLSEARAGYRDARRHPAGEPEQHQEIDAAVERGGERHRVAIDDDGDLLSLLPQQEQQRLVVGSPARVASACSGRWRDVDVRDAVR